MLRRSFCRSFLWLLASMAFATGSVRAQEFPTKPITVVVPFGAGGVTDLFARQVAEKLQPIIGQSIIVENRPGQGGSLGPRHVVSAAPDGYTVLLVGSANTIGQTLYTNLTYDLLEDFVPVRNLISLVNVLFVHPDLEVKTVQELIDYAKAHPGELQFASSGAGGVYHLDLELFKVMAGVDILHVPFRAEPDGRTDVLAGRTRGMFSAYGVVAPHLRAGQVRVLAVTSESRFSEIPDVPTVSEAGVPGYNGDAFVGLVAPKGTPDAVVQKLNAAFAKAVSDPEFKATISKQGMAVVGDHSPSDFGDYLKKEVEKWAKVIDSAGVPKR